MTNQIVEQHQNGYFYMYHSKNLVINIKNTMIKANQSNLEVKVDLD